MKKTVIVVQESKKFPNDTAQYKIEYKERAFDNIQCTLSAHGFGWTTDACEKPLATMQETGNGYKIKAGKKKFSLDYSEAEELRILLNYLNHSKDKWEESYYVEED